MLHPLMRATHRLRVEARQANPPLLPDCRQPRVLQDANVLGHPGQAHVEPSRQLADRALATGEAGQDRPAGAIRKRGEGGVEPAGKVNHMV